MKKAAATGLVGLALLVVAGLWWLSMQQTETERRTSEILETLGVRQTSQATNGGPLVIAVCGVLCLAFAWALLRQHRDRQVH